MKQILITLLIGTFFVPIPVLGQSSCNLNEHKTKEALEQCVRTVDAKNKQIKLSDLALQQSRDANLELGKQIEATREENQAFYRNPFIMGTLGLLVGAIIGVRGLK